MCNGLFDGQLHGAFDGLFDGMISVRLGVASSNDFVKLYSLVLHATAATPLVPSQLTVQRVWEASWNINQQARTRACSCSSCMRTRMHMQGLMPPQNNMAQQKAHLVLEQVCCMV